MSDLDKNPWTTVEECTAYENPWIRVSHREVLNPAGNPGIYGVVQFKNRALGVIPIDKEGYTYLVGQYRYTLNAYSWEMPEGGGPFAEDPLLAIQRELKEETGLIAKHWQQILTTYTSNSVTDEIALAYIATDLTQGEATPEETEELRVRRVPFADVVLMVLNGEITDAFTIMAVLKCQLMMDRGLLDI